MGQTWACTCPGKPHDKQTQALTPTQNRYNYLAHHRNKQVRHFRQFSCFVCDNNRDLDLDRDCDSYGVSFVALSDGLD
jgi:hypothetical protein